MLNIARQQLIAARHRTNSFAPLKQQTATYARRASPLASTSRLTLDDPLPSSSRESTSIQEFLPDGQRFPLKKPTNRFGRRNKRAAVGEILPKLTRAAALQPEPVAPGPREPFDRAQLSPRLPLVTRERNEILAELQRALRAELPSAEQTWTALVPLLRYPNVLPTLPLAFHASSTRTAVDEDGSAEHEPRTAVPLSLPELRRAFTILSSARPRTREGLARLLVIVELIVQRQPHVCSVAVSSAQSGAGREMSVGDLPGGGVGLREQDWAALILFAGASYRSPRHTHEVRDAFDLLGQYERRPAKKLRYAQRKASVKETVIYNALLLVAAKSRSWALFELIEQKMAQQGVKRDAYTLGARMEKDARRGASVEVLWEQLLAGVERLGKERATPLWNMLLWALLRRSDLQPALAIHKAMQDRTPVGLSLLAPTPRSALFNLLLDDPPPPADERTVEPPAAGLISYSMMVQGFAHHGDLRRTLELMRDYVKATHAYSLQRQPTMHMFACVFRAFATHGAPPVGHASSLVDPHLFSGKRQRTNALSAAERASPLDALSRLSTNNASSSAGNPWTLEALKSLLSSFLSLEPPLKSNRDVPHEGARTAPQSKELFWLLLAVERLTGGDSKAVMDTWEALKVTFAQARRGGDGRERWTGWKVDKRLEGVLDQHRRALRDLEELEGGH